MTITITSIRDAVCRDCGGPISKYSKTGLCRVCALQAFAYGGGDPEVRSRANLKRLENPAYREKLMRALMAGNNRAWCNPESRLRMSAAGAKNLREGLKRPEVRAKWLAGRKAACAKRSATMLAWCPPEYLEEYKRLRDRGNMRAASAKAIILAKLTPFERQMHAVKMGAAVVAKVAAPRRDPDRTLGGVTDWAA